MVEVLDRAIAPWVTLQTVRDANVADGLPDSTLDWLIPFVSRKLWDRTGRRFGLVENVTVRPVRVVIDRDDQITGYRGGVPLSSIPRRDARPGDRCSTRMLQLPGPIRRIRQVLVNGTMWDVDGLEIARDRRWVWRHDGESWPFGQQLSTDPTGPQGDDPMPAWHVIYDYGRPIPPDGAAVALQLIGHYEPLLGPDGCGLSSGLTRLQRGGVSLDFDTTDPAEGTGVPFVDDWLELMDHRRQPHARLARLIPPAERIEWRYHHVD